MKYKTQYMKEYSEGSFALQEEKLLWLQKWPISHQLVYINLGIYTPAGQKNKCSQALLSS